MRTYKSPVFQHRHYEMIAGAIKDAVATDTTAQDTGMGSWRWLCEHYADMFERDNPRFDRKRFLLACGFAVWEV
jgi:hypothetical protein